MNKKTNYSPNIKDFFLYGEWNDIPVLHLDSWNGKYNNIIFKKIFGDILKIIIFWKNNEHEIMYFSKSSQNKITNIMRCKFDKDNKFYDKLFNSYKKRRLNIIKFFDKVNHMDYSALDNKELANLFLQTRKYIGESAAIDWCSFAIDNTILKVVGLESYIENNPDKKDIILSLTAPDTILPTLSEEIEEFKLASLSKDLNKKQIIINFDKELTQLVKRFGWLHCLILYPLKTKEDYAKQIWEISKRTNLDKELKEKRNYIKTVNANLKRFIKKYNPPKKVINGIVAIKKLSEMRAIGELDVLYSFSRSRRLDREIYQRLNLKFENYLNLFVREVISLLNNKISVSDSSKRKIIEAFYRNEEGEFIRIKNSEKLYQKLVAQNSMNIELKGLPAQPGIISGKVKLIKSSKDAHHFKKGDILLAKATCVDYIMIMKKAGAIITEFGGITSHAAVVSRELKVPCIVGISNITHVLKDGDNVQVDANKGIVKKL